MLWEMESRDGEKDWNDTERTTLLVSEMLWLENEGRL